MAEARRAPPPATELNRAAAIPGLNREDAYRQELLLPPIEEQRRIAAILDHADALRTMGRRAFSRLQAADTAVFRQMFSQPGGWRPLGDHLQFLTSGSRGWARFYSATGSLFIRIQNVQDGRLLLDDIAYVDPPDSAEARRTRVKAGDVLLSITADLGRTAVIPEGLRPAYINQHLAILRAPELNPVFLAHYLSSMAGMAQLMKRNRAAVKAGLNFDDVRSVEIPVLETAAAPVR